MASVFLQPVPKVLMVVSKCKAFYATIISISKLSFTIFNFLLFHDHAIAYLFSMAVVSSWSHILLVKKIGLFLSFQSFVFSFSFITLYLALLPMSHPLYFWLHRQRVVDSCVCGNQERSRCFGRLPLPRGLRLHQHPWRSIPERQGRSSAPVPVWTLPYLGGYSCE